ncbi:MAG: PKD domain-containing protein [Pirellulales bacterium]
MARKHLKWHGPQQRSSNLRRKKSPSRRRNNLGRTVDLGLEKLEPRWVLASPGSLDTTFDPTDLDGVLVGNFGFAAGADVRLTAVTTQADGRIVAAGTVDPLDNNQENVIVARFNADGSLDSTFGTGGFTTFDFSTGQSLVGDVVIDSLNRILVVGTGTSTSGPVVFTWGAARLTSAGVLDTSFDGDGKVITSWAHFTAADAGQAHGVTLQADDKIVVVGDVRGAVANDIDFGIVRYDTNGSLDTTFGTGGRVTTDFFARADVANDLAIQADGFIVVAGSARTLSFSDDIALARFDTNGALDSTFGTAGRVNTNISGGSQDKANSVTIQADGKIVAAGFSLTDYVLGRYNTNGTLDTTFNPVPVLPSPAGTLRINFSTDDIAKAVAIQVNGQYVVGGTVVTSLGADDRRFGLARVATNGSLDTTFDADGKVETRITDYVPGTINFAEFFDLALQPDGKIVAVGYVDAPGGDENFVIARYESGLVISSIAGAPSVNEGATYTLTTTSGDPTTSQWTINWGDSTEIVAGNPSSVSHVYADGPNNYTITASITTSTGTFAVGNTVAVAVQNVAPTLAISGASDVDEAATYALNLSSLDPGADTITQWTIDWGDGIEIVGGNPASVNHTYADGDANYMISATATDEDGTFAAGSTVAVMVHNVAPTANPGGPYQTFDDTPITLTGSGADPAGVADPLTFTWDLDGDNIFGETGAGATRGDEVGASVTYNPTGLGRSTQTVALQVDDGDGGVTVATTTVQILGQGTLLIGGVLYIVGNNSANDIVVITKCNNSIVVIATFNSNNPMTFNESAITDIQVRTRGGNDIVVTTSNVTKTMTIDGGNGNDLLTGGGGHNLIIGGSGNDILFGAAGDDILLGGTGNDDLFGGSGNDVLVGGDGNDMLSGGAGRDVLIGSQNDDYLNGGTDEDVLIGGVTIHDNNVAALDAVMAIWGSAASFSSRVATLTGSGGLLEAGVAVFDDDDHDTLVGGAGRDLYFGDNNPWDGTVDTIALQPLQDQLIAVT